MMRHIGFYTVEEFDRVCSSTDGSKCTFEAILRKDRFLCSQFHELQHCDYFDYWGKGTQVTVATPRAPTSLLPLTACGSKKPTDQLTLACIARDFSPASSVTFRWKGPSGRAVSEFTQYPAVQSSGSDSYTSVSHVRVKAAERESYSCSVTHSSQCMNKEVTFQKPDQTPCLEVTLNPPKARELFVNNQAVLECVITGEERAAVEGASVTWTPSGTGTSIKESQTTQHGHVFRKTSTLTLRQERWFTEQNVQCSVQQKNSEKPAIKKSFSRNTSGSKVPEVVINTPSEEDGSGFVSLVCVVTGFSPWDVFVMWRVDDGSYEEGVTSETVESKHGTFSVTSVLEVPTAKWKSQSKVACNVKHVSVANGAVAITKSVSRATDTLCLEVTLNPPKARELFENNQAVLDCVITGEERAAVEGASVTWTPSGTGTSSKESQTTQHGHLFRKTSTLTLGRERWFTEQNVQCSVQQNSNKPAITKSFSRNTSGSTVPEVVIYTPSEEDGSGFVSLVCVVTGSSPRDVSVMWTVDDGPYEEGITSEPVESKTGTFSVISFFNVSTAKWKSQSKVTCNVKHASMANGAAPFTKSVSRATGNSIECD